MINIDLNRRLSEAVAQYWSTRKRQTDKQKQRGIADAGLRGAVTGGAQMDGFITLFITLLSVIFLCLKIATNRKSQ